MSAHKKIVLLILCATFISLSPAMAATASEEGDDAAITAQVKQALAGDSKLDAEDIKVSTYLGVVKLNGEVQTESEYAMAGQDSHAIAGVKAVANLLRIREAEQN